MTDDPLSPEPGAARTDPRDEELERLRSLLASERRRLDRELAFARRIQLNLMPTDLPVPSGWEVATAYRAARAVGGDFYDVYALPSADQSLGLVMADVTGKGLPAALMMAFSRAVMRSAAYNGSGPADALRRTNRVLVRDARTGLFLTALVARLDPLGGRLRYANAGHEFPLLRRRGSGRVRELRAPGALLGLFEHTSVADRVVTLEPGDLFFVYTDGVTDATDSDGRRFGSERLVAALREAGDGRAQDVVASVISAVDGFVGGAEPADDMTLLAVRRSPTIG
jgi:serine phosphatase RsbU (regulator of sigma subunit)